MSKIHIIAIAVVVFVVAALGAAYAASQGNYPVIWSPRTVSATATVGAEPTEVNVSFTANEDIGDVVIEPVPELADVLTVSPNSFLGVTDGSVNTVTLAFTASVDADPETLEGTLHVRPADGSQTLAKPLPATVTIVWPSVASEAGGFTISYPGEFQLQEFEAQPQGQNFGLLNSSNPSQGVSVSWRELNPESLSISEWADQQNWPTPDGDWSSIYMLTTIAGREVLQSLDTGSVVLAVDTRIYRVTNGIGIDPVYVSLDTFTQILNSLEFN
ncbi:hypothetical protein L0Y40_01915 [Candidatus Wolfebacteria bacterium]|nr:hypothetical protein [Candidatus Wolfebacteria bacterium]